MTELPTRCRVWAAGGHGPCGTCDYCLAAGDGDDCDTPVIVEVPACPACGGEGWVLGSGWIVPPPGVIPSGVSECPACGGTGRAGADPIGQAFERR